MRLPAILLATVFASPLCFGQYRCVENGKTLITDRPCVSQSEAAAPKAFNMTGDTKSSAYSSSSGAWRGQVQFMAKSGTAVVSEGHAVVSIVIEIDPRGKVVGCSTENGCVLKGIAKPGISHTITDLDITLSNCRFAEYNRQLTGRLALYQSRGYSDFSLVAYDMNKRPVRYYEIKGALRR